jgi:hypothetical protein
MSDTKFIPEGHQPYTVLLMMSDDLRSDECCASDWVRRVYVEGEASKAGIERMIKIARCDLADMFGWTDPDDDPDPVEVEQRKSAMEPVAIYAGHIFDIYQP